MVEALRARARATSAGSSRAASVSTASMAGAGSDATRVAVTGADGFIGRALVAHLAARGFDVRAITRATLGDLAVADESALAAALAGVDTVFHLAARAHVMRESAADPQAAFDAANVVATERVARAARATRSVATTLAASNAACGSAADSRITCARAAR